MYITFYIFSKILFPGFILHPTLLASLTHSIQHLSNTHLASSYIPLFAVIWFAWRRTVRWGQRTLWISINSWCIVMITWIFLFWCRGVGDVPFSETFLYFYFFLKNFSEKGYIVYTALLVDTFLPTPTIHQGYITLHLFSFLALENRISPSRKS